MLPQGKFEFLGYVYKVVSEAILDHSRLIVAQNYSLTLKRL